MGCQLLGEIVGGTVIRSKNPEIGFYKIKLNKEAMIDDVFCNFSENFLFFNGIVMKSPIFQTLMSKFLATQKAKPFNYLNIKTMLTECNFILRLTKIQSENGRLTLIILKH